MNFFYLFKYYIYIILLLIIFQSNTINKKNNIKIINTTYKDYLVWKEGKKNKTINIPLSINTLYNSNSFKKKNFESLSFPNIYKSFDHNLLKNISLIPNIYFSYKNYPSKKDISYFNVKTPTTQIFYENSINSQLIQTIFTQNIQKNINYSIHYKSLYPNIISKNRLSSINYFLITFNYNDKENKYYKIWGHIINHYINNEKNNHIKIVKKSPLLLKNSIDILNNKRMYIGQYVNIYNNIYLINRLEYEKKISIYKEKKYKNIFGNIYINNSRKDENYYNKILSEFSVKYFFKKNIFFTSGLGFYKISYYPKLKNNNLSNQINNNFLSYFGNIEYYYFNKLKFNFFNKHLFMMHDYKNYEYYYLFKIKYNMNFNSKIESRLLFCNKSPFFNIILNNSFYKKKYYLNNFNNININKLYFNYINKYINIYFNINNINYYIYFALNQKPKQSKNKLNILNLYLYKFFSLKKIKYNIFINIQNNNYQNNILSFHNLITKSCIYYENIISRKKILLQTGVVFKYFIKNLSNNYQNQGYLNNIFLFSLLKDNSLEKKEVIFLDYFINIEFFRIKVYVLIQNFNICNYLNKKKILVPNNENLIKIGLLWNMFT